jgi:hypothetical protein
MYVLYVVGPLLLAPQVKVPKAILLYILVLCTSDMLTLTGEFSTMNVQRPGDQKYRERKFKTPPILSDLSHKLMPTRSTNSHQFAGMFLLITELVFGSWKFSFVACVSYMFFDSMNK